MNQCPICHEDVTGASMPSGERDTNARFVQRVPLGYAVLEPCGHEVSIPEANALILG